MATDTCKLTTAAKKEASTGGENPKKTLEPTATKPDRKEDPSKTASSTVNAAVDAKLKDDEDSKIAVATVGSAEDNASETNIQRKIRRAERFGVPVQLSEEEKRNSRAERFGTGPLSSGSEGFKKSEEQKRKARAERFGLPVALTPADEEAKKKARLARFGGDSKENLLEEDKRKARAMRFSEPVSSSTSTLSRKVNIEQKAAIAEKAVGGS